jgi:hypothetical protein
MKRTGHLFERIAKTENLFLALRQALRGKRDKKPVQAFLLHCRENIRLLQNGLRQNTWKPSPYRTFTIYEPKERQISAAPFPDRVAHHAIINVVEPVLEKYAIADSFACRKRKGLHAAIAKAYQYQRKYGWCLKMDIKKYFASIDHAVLKSLLLRKIKDQKLLDLLGRIIDSGAEEPGAAGIPIGNLTSQHFANYFLGPLDHFVKETLRVKGYVRYMDDFCLWGGAKKELREFGGRIAVFLDGELKLRLKESAVRLAPAKNGVPFLGFLLFPDKIRLRPSSLRRFMAKVALKNWEANQDPDRAPAAGQSIQSMLGFVHCAHSRTFTKRFIMQHSFV